MVTLWATTPLAQSQRPLPGGAPDVLVGPALTVAVAVSEALEPDRLRSLARPGVSVWMTTRSNTLAESTVENLARFDGAWVFVRAPFSAADAATFLRLPRAGAWGALEVMERVRQRLGPRRLAVEIEGPLDEALFTRIDRLRPAVVRWRPKGVVDLLSWSLLRGLGGRKVLVVPPEFLLPVACAKRTGVDPAVELHVGELLAMNSDVFPCGRGTRVIVEPETDQWLLQSLVVRESSLELVVAVGADAEKASRSSRLLDALGLGPGR